MKRSKTMTLIMATLVLLTAGLFFSQKTFAAGQTLVSWPENTETNIASYKVFYSTTSGQYSDFVSVTPANVCSAGNCEYLLGGLTEDATWYFAVKAVDNNGFESVYYSPEASEYIQNQYGVGTITVSQLVAGQSSGDYSIHINADGTYIMSFVGNGAPNVTISVDQTEYIEGNYATITPNGTDPEGDALTYTCYADGIEFAGFTTNNLTVGSHNVYCAASDGINSATSDSVQVTVLDGPHIGAPSSITLTAEVGDVSVSQNFTVQNQGYGNMDWEISTTSGMLSFNQTSGTNDTVVTVTADTSTLEAGTYYGDIVVTSSDVDNSPQTVPVEVNVVYPGIDFGAASSNMAGTPGVTFPFETNGLYRLLIVAVGSDNAASNNVIGVTYGGISLIKISEVRKSGNERWISLFYLLDPPTGSNNVVVSATGSNTWAQAAYYTGVGGFVESATNISGGASTYNATLTTTVSGSWVIGYGGNTSGTNIPGVGTTVRGNIGVNNIMDANGPIDPAGITTLQLKYGSTTGWGSIIASFRPVQ